MTGTVVSQAVFVPLFVLVGVVVGREWIPWVSGLEWGGVLLVGLLFATMLTVNSPMVTIALLSETGASGPVAKTTLGTVLVADVVVILSLPEPRAGPGRPGRGRLGAAHPGRGALPGGQPLHLWRAVVVAGIVGLYLRFVKLELVLFAVVVVFATDAAARAMHFELLLSLVVAGFLVENVPLVRAEPLVATLHAMGWPVFVVFFALAGVELPIGDFFRLWPVVTVFVLLRALGIWVAGRVGARVGGAEESVRQYAWTGLLSQAGVALGLAAVAAERFPHLGAALQATVVGVITLNQTLGPVLFRRALDRSGEVVAAG